MKLFSLYLAALFALALIACSGKAAAPIASEVQPAAESSQAPAPEPALAAVNTDTAQSVGNPKSDITTVPQPQAASAELTDAAAYYNRGIAYLDRGDYDRTIADFTQALSLESKNADAYFMRGNAYFDKGDHDKARADYAQAVTLNPAKGYAAYGLDKAAADFKRAANVDTDTLFQRMQNAFADWDD